MNLPSKWKPILIRLSEALILIMGLLAAWVLWLWLADDGGFEAIYVAIAALLGGLLMVRRWLKQAGAETGTQTAVSPHSINWRQAAPTSELSTLRQQVETHFNLDELRILAADLGLNYENLAGKTLARKAHALVELCQRHGRLPDLITHLRQKRPQVEWAAPVTQPLTSQAQRIREKLLNHVQTTWIEGVLQQSIHSEIIKLSMSYRPEATGQRSWQLVLKQKGQSDQPVPPGRSLLDIFNRSGRNLLILGEPGSGKTTTMLQLAEALIEAAQENPAEPIPIVLNLSAWARDRLPLTEWLVEEIFVQYGLARELTRAGVAQNQFLYLLDGLDEILDGQARDACIVAINEFKATHSADMVICSRTAEYEALSNQLVMGSAVQIQPLNDEQIDAYLSHGGLELQAVRATLVHDQPLKELAQTPLMLGLMSLAYRSLSREELKPLADKETRRRHLFDHYVAQMFERRPLPINVHYTQAQATSWLTSLAQKMLTHGQSIFYIERLQPTWLPPYLTGHYRGLYGLGLGMVIGLIIGPIVGLGYGLNEDLSEGLRIGLIMGLSLMLGSGGATWFTTNLQKSWLMAGTGGLIAWLTYGLIHGFIYALIYWDIAWLIVGLAVALVFGFGWMASAAVSSLATNIQLREQVKFLRSNRQRVQQYLKRGIYLGLIVGLAYGIIDGLIGGLIYEEIGRPIGEDAWLVSGLIGGLIYGLIGGLIGLIMAHLDTPAVDERPYPSSGVHSSLRNAVLISTLAAIFLGLSGWFILRKSTDVDFWVIVLIANILPLTFAWFGGLAWCQHWSLRFVIARRGYLPWQLVSWLDKMVEQVLLRRVGGGWIFVHRSLMEYFASLERTDYTNGKDQSPA